MGRPLSHMIGCAVQHHIYIYDLAQSFTPQTPKASWAASSTEPICLLRRNPYAVSMYSGACDGAVLLWDLKAPPRQASLKFLQHSRAVTAAEMLNEHSLLTSSADSTIIQWDIRNSEQPVRTTVPDGKSILHLRVSPLPNLLAFATLKVTCCSLHACTVLLFACTVLHFPLLLFSLLHFPLLLFSFTFHCCSFHAEQ
jgi:WD40 repeat protein